MYLTYLMRSRQSDSSLFVITVKRITPSLVPWGTPPFSVNQSDRVLPILTACFRDVKNAAIQDKRTGWTSRSELQQRLVLKFPIRHFHVVAVHKRQRNIQNVWRTCKVVVNLHVAVAPSHFGVPILAGKRDSRRHNTKGFFCESLRSEGNKLPKL